MKNLIKNVVRSFKNNKISLIGLIFLLFFGLGTFCVMSNTTNNISSQYNSIAKKGNLHDITASELYEIGNAAYITTSSGFDYDIPTPEGKTSPFTVHDQLNELTTKLYSMTSYPITEGGYHYVVPTQTKAEGKEVDVYTRTYKLKLDATASTGLYSKFAKSFKPSEKQYVEFEVKILDEVEKGETTPVIDATSALQGGIAGWDDTKMMNFVHANPLAQDFNLFLKAVGKQTSLIFNYLTTSDTPLSKEMDRYKGELSYRFFKSINVTATKDNIFYKVIQANPNDTIDKIVLFKDPLGNYGNNLFNSTDWAPYNSKLVFVDKKGDIVKSGHEYEHFTVPSTFEELVTAKPIAADEVSTWTDEDEKYVYSQLIHIRFKRMFSGDRSTPDETIEALLQTMAAINMSTSDYYSQLLDPASDLYKTYNYYVKTQLDEWAENIIVSMNGNIVVNWQIPVPITCTMVNWTSHFSIINPQHLQANKKHVIDVSAFNSFEPYSEWYKIQYEKEPKVKEINPTIVEDWFNTLNNQQFNFWWRPSTCKANEMKYTIYNKNGTIAKEITVSKTSAGGKWNGVSDESIASCGDYNQIIWGCGLSPDFMYPVVDITKPTPNVKTECLTYVNDAGYKSLKLAFVNSPTEDFLVAKFMPSVTTTRQNEIINLLNKFCAESMLFPKTVKAVYRANDTTNVLNSSAFRVSYIPNLVRVINIVSVILCSFLGILALVICLIIIKRYVENNRVNIGIMRANGISKFKIALSLFPFALLPALVGGIGAYLVGLFLQIPMLKLFGNYWTLPTPILGFDWISMVTCIFLPFLLFGIVTVIATLWVLRTKSVELMKSGSEFKTNGFSKIAKKPFKHFGILTRFRVALAFNSLSRLVVMALMSCLTMTSLVFAMTSFGKLNKSQAINSSQFDYSFNLQLTTPTSAGGNYAIEDWSATKPDGSLKGFGYTNPDEYIYNVGWTDNDVLSLEDKDNLTKWYSNNLITVLDIWGDYRKSVADNGNLMLPTAADAIGQKQDLQYLMNKTCSKFTLDYVIGLGSLSSNPWEIALALMPANSRNTAADSYNTIVATIGALIEEKKDPKWTPYSSFFTHKDEEHLAYPYEMDVSTKSWPTLFSPEYAEFLVKIYTDKDLMKQEYRISYGIIPTNWTEDGKVTKKDEQYTYINGTFKELSTRQRPTFDPSHEITIEGIAENSNYIKLTDSKGKNLNDVLYKTKEDDDYEWVIINAFAAHKYNLGVGSTFSIDMTNMVDRYDRQMHPEEFKKPGAKSSIAKFKVLAISQGTNGEAFYCKQKPANQLLGLPDGENWNSTHKYMLWQDYSLLANREIRLIDLSCQGASDTNHYAVYAFDPTTGKMTKEANEVERFNNKTPEGFNGIYTADKSGKPLTSGISLYSYSGLYPGSSVFDSDSVRTLLCYKNNLALANFMTGINDAHTYEMCAKWLGDNPPTEAEYIDGAVQPFIDNLLRKNYGDTTMVTCICGAMDVAASDLIYKNLISTFNLAETSIMSVIIPITIIVVGIISNLIINDSRKMAAMLKALGYSDKKNAMSILALFIPTIVLGLALAIPLSIGITSGYKALIFGSANILIDMTTKWWYYVASIGGIGVVLIATYVVGWASLKRDRLVDQIKR